MDATIFDTMRLVSRCLTQAPERGPRRAYDDCDGPGADAVFGRNGSDKSLPRHHDSDGPAERADRNASGSAFLRGKYRCKGATAVSVFGVFRQHRADNKRSDMQLAKGMAPASGGSSETRPSSDRTPCVIEAIAVTQPILATPAPYESRDSYAYEGQRTVMRSFAQGLPGRPGVARKALQMGAAAVASSGGSETSRYAANDRDEVCGMSAVMTVLQENADLHGDRNTVLAHSPARDAWIVARAQNHDVIRLASNPPSSAGDVAGLSSGFAVTGSAARLCGGHGVSIDAETGRRGRGVAEQESKRRRASSQSARSVYQSGVLWKYPQEVGPARNGAVTLPGASQEIVCYADQ